MNELRDNLQRGIFYKNHNNKLNRLKPSQLYLTMILGIIFVFCLMVSFAGAQETPSYDCLDCHGTPTWSILHSPPETSCTVCHIPEGVGPHDAGTCVSCHGEPGLEPKSHPLFEGDCTECHGLSHSKEPAVSWPRAKKAPEEYSFPEVVSPLILVLSTIVGSFGVVLLYTISKTRG